MEVLELARPATDASEVSDDRPVAAADDVDLPIGIIGGEPVGLSLVGPEYRRPALDIDFYTDERAIAFESRTKVPSFWNT